MAVVLSVSGGEVISGQVDRCRYKPTRQEQQQPLWLVWCVSCEPLCVCACVCMRACGWVGGSA